MKKPSTLAQQIQQAQREFNSWPPERKARVQLEGNSSLLSRFPEQRHQPLQLQKEVSRKK